MNRRSSITVSLGVLLVLLSHGALRAQSTPWLPPEGELVTTPSYTFQTFDRFWFGSDKMDFPETDQQTVLATLEYGILDDLTFDVTVGYSRTLGSRPGVGDEDGLADSKLGLRWRCLDEYRTDSEWAPSIALRAGAIIEGTYEANLPESVGDGASGVEGSLLLGKTFYLESLGEIGFSGEVGMRARSEDVPDDFFFSVGAYKAFENGVSLSIAHRHNQGLSGPDIGDPGFSFPEVKEIQGNFEYGAAFRDEKFRSIGVYAAHTLYGRNTAEKLIIGLSVTVPFGVGSPVADLFRGEPSGDEE